MKLKQFTIQPPGSFLSYFFSENIFLSQVMDVNNVPKFTACSMWCMLLRHNDIKRANRLKLKVTQLDQDIYETKQEKYVCDYNFSTL